MIYLDNNATTPLDPAVVEKMAWFIREHFGNPSSLYPLGRTVKDIMTEARETVAGSLGAGAAELIFTGSGTESDNFAIRGFFEASPDKNELITSTIEHPAVYETAKYLQKKGVKVTFVPVDSNGLVDLDFLERSISPKTGLISIMHANNEIGTVQPIRKIVDIARKNGVPVHTDAVQTFGKKPLDVKDLGVDYLSVSAHKIYGPKGVGALYIRRGAAISPIIFGGHQEHRLRAGTENTPGIVGFGEAVRVLNERQDDDNRRLAELAAALKKGIEQKIPHVKFNGHPEHRINSTVNFAFPGIEAEAILLALATKDICVSTGSACSEGGEEVSQVLSSIGVKPEIARSSIRMSLGRFNTAEDIETVLNILPDIVRNFREISALDI